MLVAALGLDREADTLLDMLEGEPLELITIRVEDSPTGRIATLAANDGTFAQAAALGAASLLAREHVPDAVLRQATTLLCHLDSNQRTTHHLLLDAMELGIRTVLDLTQVEDGALGGLATAARVVICDDVALSTLVRELHPGGLGDFTGGMLHGLPDARLHELCRATLRGHLVVRLGARGVFVSPVDGPGRLITSRQPADRRLARGGSECFAGVLCSALDNALDLRASTTLACATVAAMSAKGGGPGAFPDHHAFQRLRRELADGES